MEGEWNEGEGKVRKGKERQGEDDQSSKARKREKRRVEQRRLAFGVRGDETNCSPETGGTALSVAGGIVYSVNRINSISYWPRS